ncbi:MAG TPA: hypothetical protein VM029_14945, partial [Opitutaceae bacterium]|nr:hypothetical protein [Opitutaceae bacterium]
MKRFLLLAATLLATIIGVRAQSATLTAPAGNYAAAGGQITLTATIVYPVGATPSSLAFTMVIPAGWQLVSTGGPNIPDVIANPGTTGELGYAYFSSFPATQASFTAVVSYPAGLVGNQTITAAAEYRSPATNLTVTPITLIPTPEIVSVSPNTAAQTATITINGAGFTNATAVKFNGVNAASYNVVSDAQITAVVPTLGTSGNVTVTRADGTTVLTSPSAFTVLSDPRLKVVSRGGTVNASAPVLVGTFTVEGTGPKKFLLRGVGPALVSNPAALSDPFLGLIDSTGTLVASNDNWGTNVNLAEIQSVMTTLGVSPPYTNTASNDAALLVSLNPGTYSARLSGGPTASV